MLRPSVATRSRMLTRPTTSTCGRSRRCSERTTSCSFGSVRSQTPIGRGLADFAIDVSDYPDINELMLVSDVLVTDYSSAIYEFSLLGRPMVFFAPDYAAYEKERGFYFDYRTGVPGPIFEETEPLAAYLRAGEFDLERVDRFRRASFDVADGGSSARVTDALILPSLTRAGDPR